MKEIFLVIRPVTRHLWPAATVESIQCRLEVTDTHWGFPFEFVTQMKQPQLFMLLKKTQQMKNAFCFKKLSRVLYLFGQFLLQREVSILNFFDSFRFPKYAS